MSPVARVIRGRVLSFRDDPAEAGNAAITFIEDGAIAVSDGRIAAVGRAARGVGPCAGRRSG